MTAKPDPRHERSAVDVLQAALYVRFQGPLSDREFDAKAVLRLLRADPDARLVAEAISHGDHPLDSYLYDGCPGCVVPRRLAALEAVAEAAVALLGEVGFMRSVVASGERLSADELARQDRVMARAADRLTALDQRQEATHD